MLTCTAKQLQFALPFCERMLAVRRTTLQPSGCSRVICLSRHKVTQAREEEMFQGQSCKSVLNCCPAPANTGWTLLALPAAQLPGDCRLFDNMRPGAPRELWSVRRGHVSVTHSENVMALLFVCRFCLQVWYVKCD